MPSAPVSCASEKVLFPPGAACTVVDARPAEMSMKFMVIERWPFEKPETAWMEAEQEKSD